MSHALLIEDDVDVVRTWCLLTSGGVSRVATVAETLRLLETAPDWVLLAQSSTAWPGMAVMDGIREAGLAIRVVVGHRRPSPP